VHLQPETEAPIHEDDWIPCRMLHELALAERSRELGLFRLGRQQAVTTRLILHKALAKGRHALTVKGERRRDTISQDAARAAREPWVLATSLSVDEANAVQVTKMYSRRMTIEQSFRDLKSSALGSGFEHSLTHKAPRLANLLLLFALVQFTAWLVGLHEEQRGEGGRLENRNTKKRRHHSTLRLGMEVLRHPSWWPPLDQILRFIEQFALGCPEPLCAASPS
jgi:hypothetical protein